MIQNQVDQKPFKKVLLNHKRNKAQDNTEALDTLANEFTYQAAKSEYWNPESFSLLYGTPLWDQASKDEKIILNQLYWVAYYSQIISAEIATIFFNQTCAASLYSIDGFRSICDMLDLESSQERAHINAFMKISHDTEAEIFGESIFSYPMKSPYTDTMIYSDTNRIKSMVRKFLLKYFALLSSSRAFIGCQYFTIRGLRTLNGKLVQHKLSQYYSKHPDQESAPSPAKISYHHFCDESFHFNSSNIISKDILKLLPPPTKFEKMIMNRSLLGCQYDHKFFSSTVNGIFWYEPALFEKVYRVLRSRIFKMNHQDAKEMMWQCYAKENEGSHLAQETHRIATASYESYLEDLDYIEPENRKMNVMKKTSLAQYHEINRRSLKNFFATKDRQYA